MLKTVCPHFCKDCFAIHVCAVHAVREDNGAILIDTAKCIGCGSCKSACIDLGLKALEKSKPWDWVQTAA
jgi:Fe-S-cluster-containing hydrogenase component 2